MRAEQLLQAAAAILAAHGGVNEDNRAARIDWAVDVTERLFEKLNNLTPRESLDCALRQWRGEAERLQECCKQFMKQRDDAQSELHASLVERTNLLGKISKLEDELLEALRAGRKK